MGERSKIEWTDHTFNPWLGCQHVSPGCEHCYAETLMDKRLGKVEWGPHGTRTVTSEHNWRQPELWDRRAAESGLRARVFCGSLCDVFERRKELVRPRLRLFGVIDRTPHLDWLLLTKRPENIRRMWPAACQAGETLQETFGLYRPNVWLGTSVEDRERSRRCSAIAGLHDLAPLVFVSGEPLLGELAIEPWLMSLSKCRVDWLIVGGESGPHARPMDLNWARALRDQCAAWEVPFFMKQICDGCGRKIPFEDFPEDLQVREFPKCQTSSVKSQTSFK